MFTLTIPLSQELSLVPRAIIMLERYDFGVASPVHVCLTNMYGCTLTCPGPVVSLAVALSPRLYPLHNYVPQAHQSPAARCVGEQQDPGAADTRGQAYHHRPGQSPQ